MAGYHRRQDKVAGSSVLQKLSDGSNVGRSTTGSICAERKIRNQPNLKSFFKAPGTVDCEGGLKASYTISLNIGKKAQSYIPLKDSEPVLKCIPLSAKAVQRRIDEMASDVKKMLVSELQHSKFFIQLDESAFGCSNILMTYVMQKVRQTAKETGKVRHKVLGSLLLKVKLRMEYANLHWQVVKWNSREEPRHANGSRHDKVKGLKELPWELLHLQGRKLNSSAFAFSEDCTIICYLPKKNKNVLVLSTMHNDNQVSDGKGSKPDIILHYNNTKGTWQGCSVTRNDEAPRTAAAKSAIQKLRKDAEQPSTSGIRDTDRSGKKEPDVNWVFQVTRI
ncbi:Zinc finger MYM-type protein [Trichinella pseudospiralis]